MFVQDPIGNMVWYRRREAGFLVLEAASADDALSVLHGSTPVEVVMTDIRMPGSMDGRRLAEFVRSTWPQLKIVVISVDIPAWPTSMLVDAFFGKPINIERVIGSLKQMLPRFQT